MGYLCGEKRKEVMEEKLNIDAIPPGSSKEDIKARRQMIKDYYARWILDHPDRIVWNASMRASIHIKNRSINEILGHAARSVEATKNQFYLTTIMSNALFVKELPVKRDDKNQKPFSKMYLLKWKQCRVLVGLQKSKNEYVLYYISAGQIKKAAR